MLNNMTIYARGDGFLLKGKHNYGLIRTVEEVLQFLCGYKVGKNETKIKKEGNRSMEPEGAYLYE